MLTPSRPVSLVQCHVLFISTDHCIGVTGDVSDTKSVPPQCQNAPLQSRYKSLIAAITSKKK
ncbi:unnamed protein product [Staurois parvus]|uniref:Uncharacterized protein n=1 Tax=Staurois parvus TaxID=386267 RepID=A0ABN9EIN4_9NEOB|nr:unnamed protein product [Staurois parvus]